jgi:hypothetical protein
MSAFARVGTKKLAPITGFLVTVIWGAKTPINWWVSLSKQPQLFRQQFKASSGPLCMSNRVQLDYLVLAREEGLDSHTATPF